MPQSLPKSSQPPRTHQSAPCILPPPLHLAAAAPPHTSEKLGVAALAAAATPAAVARGIAGCEATRRLQWRVLPSLDMRVDGQYPAPIGNYYGITMKHCKYRDYI